MLILILIDVQYSQKAVFSFEKDLNGQNYSSSSFHYLVIPQQKSFICHPPRPAPTTTPYHYLENPGLDINKASIS